MTDREQDLNASVSNRIKGLMKLHGFTYESVAEATGIGKTTVYKRLVENRIPLEWLVDLSKALSVPVSDFFGDDLNENKSVVRELQQEILTLQERVELLEQLIAAKDKTISILEKDQ